MNAQNVIKILTPASAVKFVDLKKFGRVYFLTNFCPKVKSSKENFKKTLKKTQIKITEILLYAGLELNSVFPVRRVCCTRKGSYTYIREMVSLSLFSFPGNREICAAICCWNLVLKFLQIGGFHWTENPSMKIETVQRNECI